MSRIWTQAEEASRLKARFQGLSQATFAREHQLPGGASMLSQHIHNRRPLNLEHALVYARGFGVPLDEISPRLADEARAASAGIRPSTTALATHELSPAPYQAAPHGVIEAALLQIGTALQAVPDWAQAELRQRFAEFVDAPDSRIAVRRICHLLQASSGKPETAKAQAPAPQSMQGTGAVESPEHGSRRLIA